MTKPSLLVDVALALLLGGGAFAASCWLVPPEPEAHGFGSQWQLMSEAPGELRGQLPHRLLGPVLAWLVGLGGAGWVSFTYALHVLMLAMACLVCRSRGSTVVDGALIVLAVALTAPVQIYKQHWVGYTDPLCYALFFGAMLAAGRPVVFWSLFLCNLLNHELAAFLLPWLWFLRRRRDGRWRLDAALATGALAVYAAFYLWVKANAAQQLYNADYFLANPLFPGGTFAVWLLAIVHWTVAFGPVLAVLAWHQHARDVDREGRVERLHLWLVLGSVLLIFCIAFDWARHSNLIVLPFVVASVSFLRRGALHRAVYAGLVALTAALFVIVPPWGPTAWPTREFTYPELLARTGVVVAGRDGPGFGPLSASVGQWLPEVWRLLVPIVAILATIWAAGAVFARWRKPVVAPA
mgnify:CR=1 FL=1